MANYIVSDTNLTAVADAIRTKGGTSSALEFPDEFIQAIGDIQTGGGGTDELLLLEEDQLITRTSSASSVKQYTFCGCTSLTSVSYPNSTSIGIYAFYSCTKLETASFPVATSIGSSAFQNCSNLTSASFPVATSIGNSAFQNCSNLTSASFPVATSIGSYAFRGCSNLTSASFPVATSIGSYAFHSCTTLNVFILRKSGAVCSLANVNVFNNTPFASNGTGGTLYVPQSLIASYQSANNWSTILGYPNNQIKAIEGSIYE